MFTPDERDRVRDRLLLLARSDAGLSGAAITGSGAAGTADAWSDIDLAFGVPGDLAPVIERWTGILADEFAAVHHWDLPFESSVYRVFLLPGWLEVDIGFVPASAFRPRGPQWGLAFGEALDALPGSSPPTGELAGRAWHHALHAQVAIERDRRWQAEHWIGALRAQVIALACLRYGFEPSYAKGAHLLPPELTGPLEGTLVRSLDEAELRRTLGAAVTALAEELGRSDPALAAKLAPMLRSLEPEA